MISLIIIYFRDKIHPNFKKKPKSVTWTKIEEKIIHDFDGIIYKKVTHVVFFGKNFDSEDLDSNS